MLSASLYQNLSTSVPFFLRSSNICFWPAKIHKQQQHVLPFLLSQNRQCENRCLSLLCRTNTQTQTPSPHEHKHCPLGAVCPLLQNMRVKVPCMSFSCLITPRIYIWACQKARDSYSCLRLALKFIQLHPMLSLS
jgi:hypothetical protein